MQPSTTTTTTTTLYLDGEYQNYTVIFHTGPAKIKKNEQLPPPATLFYVLLFNIRSKFSQ